MIARFLVYAIAIAAGIFAGFLGFVGYRTSSPGLMILAAIALVLTVKIIHDFRKHMAYLDKVNEENFNYGKRID